MPLSLATARAFELIADILSCEKLRFPSPNSIVWIRQQTNRASRPKRTYPERSDRNHGWTGIRLQDLI
jgi:hypothetical protein